MCVGDSFEPPLQSLGLDLTDWSLEWFKAKKGHGGIETDSDRNAYACQHVSKVTEEEEKMKIERKQVFKRKNKIKCTNINQWLKKSQNNIINFIEQVQITDFKCLTKKQTVKFLPIKKGKQ